MNLVGGFVNQIINYYDTYCNCTFLIINFNFTQWWKPHKNIYNISQMYNKILVSNLLFNSMSILVVKSIPTHLFNSILISFECIKMYWKYPLQIFSWDPTKMNFKSSAETEHWSPAFDIPGHVYTEIWFSV